MSDHDLFHRVWKVTVGPAGGQGRSWDGLRTRFTVTKSGDATPNKCEVEIYNLSRDSRSYIENAGKGWAVMIEAGYSNSSKLIFTGRIEYGTSEKRGRHNHHKQGSDWGTKIEGRDGVRAYRSIILSKSFAPGATEATVINHIAKAMGLSAVKIKGLSKAKFNHGRQLSGPASAELSTLCRSRGLRWSIQDGVLQILPIGSSLDQQAIVVSPATGLVGSPERTERGVKVTTLLMGGVNPGQLIDVQGQDLKGTYIVENVHIKGDSHDNDWYSEFDCLKL